MYIRTHSTTYETCDVACDVACDVGCDVACNKCMVWSYAYQQRMIHNKLVITVQYSPVTIEISTLERK